jgi:signal transduction histidine kinase
LALTNNILDLATIDAGAMKLELGPVDIGKAIEAAAEGIQDRLATDRITLQVEVDPHIGDFTGDERAWCRCCIICSPMPSDSRRVTPP